MAKKITAVAALFFASAVIWAKNPPAGGQNVYTYVSPSTITSASTTGGAIENIAPTTSVYNPAITAFEQRVVVDLGGTIMTNGVKLTNPEDKIGGAFQIGAIIPTRYFVYTASFQGVFVPFYNMNVENTMTLIGSMSKDITDNLAVGLGIKTGGFWGAENDWVLNADAGFLYKFGNVGFMKNFRIGASLLNLGKVYTNTTSLGMSAKSEASWWPGLATLRTGAAATFVQTDNFTLGLSLDASFPSFLNAVFDLGVMMNFNINNICILGVQSSFQANILECSESYRKNLIPTLGISARFLINAQKSDFMKEKGWGQNEIDVRTSYARLYEDTNAFSFQGIMHLGTKDTEPPKIILWDEE